MASDSEKRQSIVLKAMTEVSRGGHYLSGSDGSIPDDAGSGLVRSTTISNDLNIATVCVFGASNGFGTCRGRYVNAGGKRFSKGDGGDRDIHLPAYLEELDATYLPSWFWPSFRGTGLFPRLSSKYIYLGEDCRGKRHFDCEGFIAWVLVHAIGKDKGTWRQGVDWYQNGGSHLSAKPNDMTTDEFEKGKRIDIFKYVGGGLYKHGDGRTINQGGILGGDILIRKPNPEGGEHIAFATDKAGSVLEASGKDRGVISSSYKTNWTQLGRIKKL